MYFVNIDSTRKIHCFQGRSQELEMGGAKLLDEESGGRLWHPPPPPPPPPGGSFKSHPPIFFVY